MCFNAGTRAWEDAQNCVDCGTKWKVFGHNPVNGRWQENYPSSLRLARVTIIWGHADPPDPEHSMGIEMVHIYDRTLSGLHPSLTPLPSISRAKFPWPATALSTLSQIPTHRLRFFRRFWRKSSRFRAMWSLEASRRVRLRNTCETAADHSHSCRLLYGTGLCLCRKNMKFSGRVNSERQMSSMSSPG
jgi:hypothetical protein